MNETNIEEERDKQESSAELDSLLEGIQRELLRLQHNLKQLGRRRQKWLRKIKLPKNSKLDAAKLNKEIGEIKQIIVEHKETDSLLRMFPAKEIANLDEEGRLVYKRVAVDVLTEDITATINAERVKTAAAQKKKNADAGEKDVLSIIDDPDLVDTIISFYTLYAIYTEYFNSMKMLYQVLVEEYETLGLLEEPEIRKLRNLAVEQIAVLLWRQQWNDLRGAKERREFRTRMMKAIRLKLSNKTKAKPEKRRVVNARPVSALCLSGGGIRSATFGLGIIQGLARHGLLDKFDYLSTVSGGGFIGSWLSAWVSRETRGIETVQRQLVEPPSAKVEPNEITYLRSYSNYMSPRVGLTSADTWTLVAVYCRNLLLNWLVAIPLLAAFLLLPRLMAEIVLNGQALVGTKPGWGGFTVTAISAVLGSIAIFAITVFRPSLSKYLPPGSWLRPRFVRDEIGKITNIKPIVIYTCLLPMLFFSIGVTTYWYWVGQRSQRMLLVEASIASAAQYKTTIFTVFLVVFLVVMLRNIFYRRAHRLDNNWDKLFGSIIILLCIGLGAFQLLAPTDAQLFNIVLFFNFIFIAGFVVARFVLWLSSRRSDKPGFSDNIPIEFSISYLAASLAGLLVYVVNDKALTILSRGFEALAPGQPLDPTRYETLALYANIYATIAVPLFLTIFLLAATLFVGIGSKILDDMDREWTSRLGAWILLVIVGWLLIFSIVLLGYEALGWVRERTGEWVASIGGVAGVISGAVTLIFGYYASSGGEPADGTKKTNRLMELAPQIAAPIFAIFLLILISLGTYALISLVGDKIEWLKFESASPVWPSYQGVKTILVWMAGLAGLSILMGWWVNINKFSLHGTYRERLIRAFLGASRGTRRFDTADPFTGLDPEDNVEMKDLVHRPFHVVNMTLNLGGSDNLRWQTRRSASFTATPLYCGSSNMGAGSGNYRTSKLYGADKMGNPITLGTAAAISGAAASPNMGYFTQSTPVSALMALFNVRLGWWLGNPGRRGDGTFFKNAPEFAPKLFYYEALGRTGDANPYVYLSDGGHFDNLGLYEMVIRRCRLIVLSDAGADEGFGFSDLGSAIHKIRVDMGIPIDFENGDLPVEKRNCSIAKIRYSAVDPGGKDCDGILIYLKPTLDGHEPIDVVNYKKMHPMFPHESTADQMYDEMQFESYRALGSHMIEEIWGKDHPEKCGDDCPSLGTFELHARAYLERWAASSTHMDATHKEE